MPGKSLIEESGYYVFLRCVNTKDNTTTNTKAPIFMSRLLVYTSISFLTTLLSEDDEDNCKNKSLSKKKKKARLWIKLKTFCLASAGTQKRIERSAQNINQGCCVDSFIFSKE